MQIKMIVFAMDGIICHLDKYHYLAWKTIADELGIPFTKEQAGELVGLSRMDSLNHILTLYPGTLSMAEKEVLAEQKNREFHRMIENLSHSDCDPEIENVLIQLKKRGYLLAVTSPSRNVIPVLNKLKLEQYFDYVSDGNVSRTSKPNPGRYLKLCEDARVEPADCAVVEATKRGIRAGKAAGMVTFSDITELFRYLEQ